MVVLLLKMLRGHARSLCEIQQAYCTARNEAGPKLGISRENEQIAPPRRIERIAMETTTNADLIIIGGGPAGYAAGIYAARASLDTLVLEQGMPGGQIATTDEVENYPGIPHVTGSELGMKLQAHAEELGVRTTYTMISQLLHTEDGSFTVVSDSETYRAPAVILATGATPRTAGFEGEDAFRGRGVSYCATCDGMFYRDKTVFVIGGGNAACEEALFLAHIAREVIMVVRRDVFRAPRGVVNRLLANPKVSVRYETSIVRAAGVTFINEITFRDNRTGAEHVEAFSEGSVGIFVFAGTRPETALATGLAALGPDGGIVTDEAMATATPGLFAAGDVRSKKLRQVITAAADGAVAATAAYQYLQTTASFDAARS